jgi:hypothetical protein
MSAQPAAVQSLGENPPSTEEPGTSPIAHKNVLGTHQEGEKDRNKPYLPRGVQDHTSQPTTGRLTVRRKPERNAKERERTTAGVLLDRLARAGRGECEMTSTQVQAARAYLERTRPALASVEYTETEDLPSESSLIQAIQGLIVANPALKSQLLALLTSTPQALDKP